MSGGVNWMLPIRLASSITTNVQHASTPDGSVCTPRLPLDKLTRCETGPESAKTVDTIWVAIKVHI